MRLGNRVVRGLAAWALLATMGGAQAAAFVEVEAVQPPAWVERGERRLPLAAGQRLHNRDRIVTGGDARVLLRLSEGSAVKLGADASLRLDALGEREPGVFTAAFDVAKGAFRFTTGLFSRYQDRRAVNVRVATVTAGIRGTDLWGSSDAERDLVCLIEGRITVSHPDAEAVAMSEPMSFYVVPKGQAPQPVAAVDRRQLAQWALETELRQAAPLFRKAGRWQVLADVAAGEGEALALYDRLRDAGYPVRIRPQPDGQGGYRYAVSVPQLASRGDAEALATRLRQELGLAAARAGR
ncbi:FecR domain-containing protein [Azospira restricta]|uniref:FecR domain-containing protein n=1 Tax=Azospira restricta TaxID=404405 RepID=A0A974SP58_9RHOO|nr:FecR domain-containing protein [Azospira restricta]QRJ63886.1 FecR domain-containing protein [Azospira restricta]